MEDLQKVNRALNDLWKLYKATYGKELKDDVCDEWIQKTKEIYDNSQESPLVMDLIRAFTDSVEGRSVK